MEELTKQQMVMLVILVSFITSIATGIVTVTLVNQAPPPITQTINRVVEKTIETVSPENLGRRTIVVTEEDRIVQISEDIAEAVVSIVATKDVPVVEQFFVNPFGENSIFPDFLVPQFRQKGTERRQISSGTGFFVSKDGLVVTNRHVVADMDAEYTLILNNGKKIPVDVVARSPFQDLAILKVKTTEKQTYHALSLGGTSSLKIGQTVIAVGNALGEFSNTVSVGIISGLDRRIVADTGSGNTQDLRKLIQTDAAINPGNSGGPLVNLSGSVIGINTAVARSAENIGFALPVTSAQKHVADIQKYGTIEYPYLGIVYRAHEKGIELVKGERAEPAVDPNGPAKLAGLRERDIIDMTPEELVDDVLSVLRVGDSINLKVFRGDVIVDITVVLGKRPKNL